MSVPVVRSGKYLTVEYQLEQLREEVSVYSSLVARTTAGIQEVLFAQKETKGHKSPPSTPPILRVEKAALEAVPVGEALQRRALELKSYFSSVDLLRNNGPEFDSLSTAVGTTTDGLKSMISSFRSQKAPPVNISDRWPVGSGYSQENYRKELAKELSPQVEKCQAFFDGEDICPDDEE